MTELLKVLNFVTTISCLLLYAAAHGNQDGIRYILNGKQGVCGSVLYIKSGDRLALKSSVKGKWFIHTPVYKDYTNVKGGLSPRINYYDNIDYTSMVIPGGDSLDVSKFIESRGTGTYYFSRAKSGKFYGKLSTPFPLHEIGRGIIQVVVRGDDTYTGYLEELRRTPFIWTPKMIKEMYQCDERVGSDCISFVIYGRRRMGHDVRYTSLDKVKRYLSPVTHDRIKLTGIDGREVYTLDGEPVSIEKYSITRGTFLHFGVHAAIFYEDRGVPGILDREDLVIQSTELTPGISALNSTGYSRHTLGIYEWKE